MCGVRQMLVLNCSQTSSALGSAYVTFQVDFYLPQRRHLSITGDIKASHVVSRSMRLILDGMCLGMIVWRSALARFGSELCAPLPV